MDSDIARIIDALPPDRPVLIAGPTASGKSALALRIARDRGGMILNADALQVFGNWHILTARPDPQEEARAPHHLYGHVDGADEYSVGHWLRDVARIRRDHPGVRPIIVGGTGLYFRALTEGLAEVPAIPPAIRAEADAWLAAQGPAPMLADLDRRDPATAQSLDRQNPRRVQRAWEVLQATGRGLVHWHRDTPAPPMPLAGCAALVLEAPPAWLTPRIEARLHRMIKAGVLEEVRANMRRGLLDPTADGVKHPSSKAIGASQLREYLQGALSLDAALDRAVVETRRYAKRQRTWFRTGMADWQHIDAARIG